MEVVKNCIQMHKMIKEGDVIGVGVSGGKDSMALLHYLHTLSKEMEFEVVAITVDHGIRENAMLDVMHVINFCKKNKIRAYKFKVNAPNYAAEHKMSLETAAREVRYGVFEKMFATNVVDKIAIAHNKQDQAETVLLNLFRGCALNGASGMDYVSGKYLRPMLDVEVKDIWAYITEHDIEIAKDETNEESDFSRNYIRNQILPLVEQRWQNVTNSIVNFAQIARRDEKFISNNLPTDSLIVLEKEVRIPLSVLFRGKSVSSRLMLYAINKIGLKKDVEYKHIEMLLNFASGAENGKKISLPNLFTAHKEYDFLTITNQKQEEVYFEKKHRVGTVDVPNFGKLQIRNAKMFDKEAALFVDADNIPKTAIWRFRQDGDFIEKFGGGTKKIKSFLADLKIPLRKRNSIPMLCDGNEVFVVANLHISNKLKVTQHTKRLHKITLKEQY